MIAAALPPVRCVWGGIWGLLFFLPMLNAKPLLKGSLLSLFPTLVQLFVVFPIQSHKGIAGVEPGLLTPWLVLVVNWVGGWSRLPPLNIQGKKECRGSRRWNPGREHRNFSA
ncbi:MAG: hypothetical protein KKF30_12615 [Proteobacteria bacterium]|nr:hypothetical protein [Pseudomonadota bacterium]MBU4470009.1 hypothetical protein [Pseudomonadota bacterium]MCG2753790.1 hypothetical protein [Desulfobacteraceae bacterium]